MVDFFGGGFVGGGGGGFVIKLYMEELIFEFLELEVLEFVFDANMYFKFIYGVNVWKYWVI